MNVGQESVSEVARSRRARVGRSGRVAAQFAQALARIVASKTRLTGDLEVLFRASRGLPLRLALADHRRTTNTHLDRLHFVITMVAGRGQPPVAPVPEGSLDVAKGGVLSPAAVVAEILGASQAAVSQYQAAIAMAAESKLTFAVNLLTTSLTEEVEAARRFSTMVDSTTGG